VKIIIVIEIFLVRIAISVGQRLIWKPAMIMAHGELLECAVVNVDNNVPEKLFYILENDEIFQKMT